MALKGNLQDFSFLQLLNLINLARKTGALHIETNQRNADLFFKDGKLTYGFIGGQQIPLVRILGKANLIPASQAAIMADRFKGSNDKETGILLINSGYLSRERILKGVEQYFSGLIRDLFALDEGEFDFLIGREPPEDAILASMDLTDLIVEGSHQVQEIEELVREIPNLDLSIRLLDLPGRDLRRLNLNAVEWRVVSYANPRNTLRQIAGAAQVNEFQVRKAVYTLLQTGVIELVRPAGTGALVEKSLFSLNEIVQQKTLVNRVIDRIKAI